MPRIKLTKGLVRSLQPPEVGRVEYFDAEFPSFGLRVTETGAKSWFLYYRVGQRQRRLTLGRYPTVELDGARKAARKARVQVDEGIDPAFVRAERKTKRIDTVGEVVDEFIERYAKPRNRSWRQTERLFGRDVLKPWGRVPIQAITKRDVRHLIDRIVDRGSPHAAHAAFKALRKLFNWAVEQEIIDTDWPPTGRFSLTQPTNMARQPNT
jgi:hypothetical protein